MNWKIEIDWEWLDKYGIDNRNTNTFQYGNIYAAVTMSIALVNDVSLLMTACVEAIVT